MAQYGAPEVRGAAATSLPPAKLLLLFLLAGLQQAIIAPSPLRVFRFFSSPSRRFGLLLAQALLDLLRLHLAPRAPLAVSPRAAGASAPPRMRATPSRALAGALPPSPVELAKRRRRSRSRCRGSSSSSYSTAILTVGARVSACAWRRPVASRARPGPPGCGWLLSRRFARGGPPRCGSAPPRPIIRALDLADVARALSHAGGADTPSRAHISVVKWWQFLSTMLYCPLRQAGSSRDSGSAPQRHGRAPRPCR